MNRTSSASIENPFPTGAACACAHAGYSATRTIRRIHGARSRALPALTNLQFMRNPSARVVREYALPT
jgi:hypothetical protein